MTILQLRALAHSKRSAARKILDAVASSAETRDMAPDEKASFDKLMGDVETIKGQVAQLESIEADEGDEPEAPAAAEASRSSHAAPTRRSAPIGEPPAVHAEPRPYSYLRAIRLAADGRRVDGVEGEVSQEIATRSGRSAQGFFLPTGSDPEMRALMSGRGRRPETRTDLTVSTGTGAIFNVPELPLIDLLRAKLVIAQLGATMLNNMHGTFSIPRQSGKASVYWLAEGSSATVSAPTIDQVAFVPKVALAATNISRLFMAQTSVDAETFVKNDLAASLARDLDRVAIKGGGSNEPTGILGTTAVATQSSTAQGGTNGLAPTYAQLVLLETLVAVANADEGSLAYLTNPNVRGLLKTTPKIGSTFPTFVWGDSGNGVGEVNGYKARTTTNVPNNLTKGSASAICSAIIFGDFSSLVVSTWEGVDTVVNPYSNQLSGAVQISMAMSVDVKLRHPESFAAIFDALA